MDRPLVSVIMPVYNVEKYLWRSVESVLTQRYKDFELLVVDDGSTDRCSDILGEIDDPRVKVFRKPNGGLSDARNFGLRKSKGELIYFIDSDDWISPDLLEKAVCARQLTGAEVVMFGYRVVRSVVAGGCGEAVVSEPCSLLKGQSVFPLDEKFLRLLGFAWNKLYTREVILENGLWFPCGISLVEDMLFNAEVFCRVSKFVVLDDPLYNYAIHGGETLMTKYYPDSFDLKLARANATDRVFASWGVSAQSRLSEYNQALLRAARFSVGNLFSSKNELSFSEKVSSVKHLLRRGELDGALRVTSLGGARGRLFSLLLRIRSATALSLFASISR